MSPESTSLVPELPKLTFHDQPFTFIKHRRNGTKIFGADDGESFLRFGPANGMMAIGTILKRQPAKKSLA